jgi:hypothetical protein
MLGEKYAPESVEPTIITVQGLKSRLLLSHYLRDHEIKGLLVKLYRPFVASLSDMVRNHGLGCGNFPSYYDAPAMMELVERFELDRHIYAAWRNLLSHPEKLSVDRIIGCGCAAQLCYGVELTSQISELGISFATESVVDGRRGLFNEVRRRLGGVWELNWRVMGWVGGGVM